MRELLLHKRRFFTVLLCIACVAFAQRQRLTEEDKGRILCTVADGRVTLWSFVRPTEEGQLHCYNLDNGMEQDFASASMLMLPFSTDSDSFMIDMYITWYMSQATATKSTVQKIYREVSRHFSTPFNETVREFYAAVNAQDATLLNDINRLAKARQKKNSEKSNRDFWDSSDYSSRTDEIIDEIIEEVINGRPLAMLRDLTNQRAYFTVVLLFGRYKEILYARLQLGGSKLQRNVARKLDMFAEDIVKNFRADRELAKPLEEKYKEACPKAYGVWRQAMPVDINGMNKLAASVFESFEKSMDLSPEIDFPAWGSCMLDIFVMFPQCELLEKQTKVFTESYDNFVKTYGKGTK